MPITKYKTADTFNPTIERVEVAGETEKQVIFFDGKRALKETQYGSYFDSFEDAKIFLLNKIAHKVDCAVQRQKYLTADLLKVIEIREENTDAGQ